MFLKITGYVPPGSYITLIGRPISDDVFSNGVMFLTREHNTNWGMEGLCSQPHNPIKYPGWCYVPNGI